jgi:uncharacterized cysteine cluster protein YcgN (CxxCxxCC family)
MTTNLPHENPFKLFLKVIVTFIACLAIGLLLFGCASKPIESTHTIERIIEHKTDSVKTTQVNAAILDSLVIKIAKVKTVKPECDSITQATLDQVLRQLNTYKKSGNNEYKMGYDEALRQVVLSIKQAETKIENTATNKTDTDKGKEKEIVEIPVKYIPWWVEWLAYLGAATLLFGAYRISRIWV